MNSLIVSSTRANAGKTSIVIGLSKILSGTFGYIKPLGDRFVYRKKRLWDYDAALLSNLFGIGEDPERMSIGFDHSKLRYMYGEKEIAQQLWNLMESASEGNERLFVESGRNLSYGASIHLDPLTMSKTTGTQVLIVASADEEDEIADDLAFIRRFVSAEEAHVGGVILNKIKKPDDFSNTYMEEIEDLGINVLGVIPYNRELTTFSAGFVAEKLFARVIGGEEGLRNTVQNVFVGAMSVDAAFSAPQFAESNKLIITSGDRSDFILAAVDSGDVACIVLTHNIIPPANIIAKATEAKVPLLLVPSDTYDTAREVDALEPLVTKEDTKKIDLLAALVKENIDIDAITRLVKE